MYLNETPHYSFFLFDCTSCMCFICVHTKMHYYLLVMSTFQLADPDSSQHMYNVLFVYACTILYVFYEVLNIVV